jgi:hypothetical protein
MGDVTMKDGKVRNDYIWGASIVEILLGKIIELWKIQNDEVHGIAEEIQEKRQKHRLVDKVKHLNQQKNNARLADMGLFHENIDQYIEDSTARTLEKSLVVTPKQSRTVSQHGQNNQNTE